MMMIHRHSPLLLSPFSKLLITHFKLQVATVQLLKDIFPETAIDCKKQSLEMRSKFVVTALCW